MVKPARPRSPAPALALGLLLLLLLPVPPARGEDEAGRSGATPAPTRFLGVDAVDPFAAVSLDRGRVLRLAGVGDLLVRTRPVEWGRIEPRAPLMRDRQLHDWEDLDAFVATWTEAGFEVVLVLSPKSPWAASPAEASAWLSRVRAELPPDVAGALALEATGATAPDGEHWAEWERFVRDVAERYDGDGVEDADGLGRPVRWIQVVDRPISPRSWLGSAAEYSRLLHLASQGAAKASPAVRVVHGAVDFGTLGHRPFPAEDVLLARAGLRGSGPLGPMICFETRRTLSFALLTLSMRRLYGAAAHVGSGHLSDEAADLSFLRHLLDQEGRQDLESWLIDTPTAKLEQPRVRFATRFAPEEGRIRARARAVRPWFERGQAFDVVRTVVNARAAGADRVFLGGGPAAGGDGARLFVAGTDQKPAWYALRQLGRRLGGHETVSEERIGREAAAFRFAFPAGGAPPWVLVVVRDPDRSWAGSPTAGEVPTDAALRLPNGIYVVEQLALADGEPARRRIEVTSGAVTLPLTSAPVYVYPDA